MLPDYMDLMNLELSYIHMSVLKVLAF